MTPQALALFRAAERRFHLLADPLTREWLLDLCPDSEDLADTYAVGRPRAETYQEMVRRMLTPVEAGLDVAAAFYGHPGVYAFPPHEAIRRARAAGHAARMLPGVSALDCLIADLGVDPGASGLQSFEATDFLLRRRRFDPDTPLVLWQIGLVGVVDVRRQSLWSAEGLALLTERLLASYPRRHRVTVYEAATLPIEEPVIATVPLSRLPEAPVTALSTLYVPARRSRPVDLAMARRMGIGGAAQRRRAATKNSVPLTGRRS